MTTMLDYPNVDRRKPGIIAENGRTASHRAQRCGEVAVVHLRRRAVPRRKLRPLWGQRSAEGASEGVLFLFAPQGRPKAQIAPPLGAAQRRRRKRGGPFPIASPAACPASRASSSGRRPSRPSSSFFALARIG